MEQVDKTASGMVWRIVGTILVFTAFPNGYSLFQKIVVVLVALILAIATVAIMWVSWAGRRGWIHDRWGPSAR